MSRAAAALVALALTVLVTGCETSADRSAELEREAKRHAHGSTVRGLTITRPSTTVKVSKTAVATGSEGSAAIVTLSNRSGRAVREVPLAITVRDARGATVFVNDTPGLARSLVSVPYVPAHGRIVWVNDQVRSSGGPPATVTAIVGQAPVATGAIPRIATREVRLAEDPGGATVTGTVTNYSTVAQRELVVYAVSRKAGRTLAAGRAILSQLDAHASAAFEIFLVGDPSGGRLEVKAPPTTLG